MSFEDDVVRIVRSRTALDTLIESIAAGEQPRPDWIHLQAEARLDRLDREEWPELLRRIHGVVRRGFRTAELPNDDPDDFVDDWRRITSNGFHDFSAAGWSKCYDSPVVEDYDYIGPSLEGGLDALDPYAVYGSVLGSHDYGVEAFVRTKRCADVRTVIEPMAGSAEFVYQGHFRYPDFRYLMIDLDRDACDRVLAQPWLPETEHHYVVADVLDEDVWKQAKSMSSGPSLAFIGKQSHQLFDVRQLCRLLELGTLHADSLILETPAMSLVGDMDGEEDMSRPEMEAVGLYVGLVDEPGTAPHPYTNRMSFRLEASDESGSRTLFSYPRWTVWSQPTLVALAELQDLHMWFYHSALDEFVPVDSDASETDCHENVTFMLFSRSPGPPD